MSSPLIHSLGSGIVQHTCEEVEGGIKVTLQFEADMSGWLAKIAAPLLRGQIDKRMIADLQSFKEFVES